jgi:hypothetical protein
MTGSKNRSELRSDWQAEALPYQHLGGCAGDLQDFRHSAKAIRLLIFGTNDGSQDCVGQGGSVLEGNSIPGCVVCGDACPAGAERGQFGLSLRREHLGGGEEIEMHRGVAGARGALFQPDHRKLQTPTPKGVRAQKLLRAGAAGVEVALAAGSDEKSGFTG